ncbi:MULTISPECIES: hypothetical protein [unclassified Pseudomonas]|uniref:hypothetical protein n=1 Tax=unclassified Pseudomonas TaxID=196821 RepID=UPI0011B78876|nr:MULTISPECIES: hypothetical protein [unclassified Pseudomonas]
MSLNPELLKILQSEDDLGAVIRSHIIIEQYLNKIIESRLVSADHYKKIKLNYHNTIKLAIALGLDPRLEKALNALGTLRNDFAHKLRPEISKQDVKNLYTSLDETDKELLQNSFNLTRKNSPALGISNYQELSPKDKYILNAIVLCGALQIIS